MSLVLYLKHHAQGHIVFCLLFVIKTAQFYFTIYVPRFNFCKRISNFARAIYLKDHLCSIVLFMLLCQERVAYIYVCLFLKPVFYVTDILISFS